MAYFPNGTSAGIYEETYCCHCLHQKPDDGGCPVMMAHFFHNYDAVGENANKPLSNVLNALIPMDGIEPQRCKMFVPSSPERCEETQDMFNNGGVW
jgi:hypothetical protein